MLKLKNNFAKPRKEAKPKDFYPVDEILSDAIKISELGETFWSCVNGYFKTKKGYKQENRERDVEILQLFYSGVRPNFIVSSIGSDQCYISKMARKFRDELPDLIDECKQLIEISNNLK